jgi:hypothetical protein
MRLRALPPSFWQQPNKPNIPPSTMYLPPLFRYDIENVVGKKIMIIIIMSYTKYTLINTHFLESELNLACFILADDCKFTEVDSGPADSLFRDVKISSANTDLLFKLFDGVDQREKKQAQFQTNLQQYKTNR